jgi:hypothetical protein
MYFLWSKTFHFLSFYLSMNCRINVSRYQDGGTRSILMIHISVFFQLFTSRRDIVSSGSEKDFVDKNVETMLIKKDKEILSLRNQLAVRNLLFVMYFCTQPQELNLWTCFSDNSETLLRCFWKNGIHQVYLVGKHLKRSNLNYGLLFCNFFRIDLLFTEILFDILNDLNY